MSSVPTHSNVLSTIDSISCTDLGAQFALQVGERILAIDHLEEHALEVSVDDCFPSQSARKKYLPVLVAPVLRGPSSHAQCHPEART